MFKRNLLLAMIIVLVALCFRGLLYFEIKDVAFIKAPILDSHFYQEQAKQILGEDIDPRLSYKHKPFFMSPGYPYFLALTSLIPAVSDLEAAIFTQYLIGAALAVLLFLITARFTTLKIAFITGMLAAIYRPLAFYESHLLADALACFFVVLMLHLLYIALDFAKPGIGLFFLSGVIGGVSVLMRTNYLLFCLLVPLGVWLSSNRFNARESIARSLLVLAGVLSVIMPVIIRNALLPGGAPLITNNLGINLYIGNNPRANGSYKPLMEAVASYDPEAADYAQQQAGKKMTSIEVSAFYRNKALEFIATHPLKALKLTARKALMLFNDYEIPQIYNIHYYARISRLISAPWLPTFGWIFVPGAVGMVTGLRNWRRYILIYLLILSVSASVIPFFITARFRLAIAVSLMIFSGIAIQRMLDLARYGRIKELSLSLLVAVVALIICLLPLPVDFTESGMVYAHAQLASAYRKLGDDEAALAEMLKFLEHEPNNSRMLYNVGYLNLVLGRLSEAERYLERAVSADADFANAWGLLFEVRYRLGKKLEAKSALTKLKAIMPQHPKIDYNLGVLCMELGDLHCAMQAMQRSLVQSPDDPLAISNLATLYANIGELKRARELYQRALELVPELSQAKNNLARLEKIMDTQTTIQYGNDR